MRFRSKVTPTQFRQKLVDLGLSQRSFAKLTCVPRETVCSACNSKTYIARDLANALKIAEITIALRALVNNHHRRPGWGNVKRILAIAEDPVVLQKRKPGRKGAKYRPRRPKIPQPVFPAAPPPPVDGLPTRTHPAGPPPAGFTWTMRNHTWTLQPVRVEQNGPI
jgi:hypothetical protein